MPNIALKSSILGFIHLLFLISEFWVLFIFFIALTNTIFFGAGLVSLTSLRAHWFLCGYVLSVTKWSYWTIFTIRKSWVQIFWIAGVSFLVWGNGGKCTCLGLKFWGLLFDFRLCCCLILGWGLLSKLWRVCGMIYMLGSSNQEVR